MPWYSVSAVWQLSAPGRRSKATTCRLWCFFFAININMTIMGKGGRDTIIDNTIFDLLDETRKCFVDVNIVLGWCLKKNRCEIHQQARVHGDWKQFLCCQDHFYSRLRPYWHQACCIYRYFRSRNERWGKTARQWRHTRLSRREPRDNMTLRGFWNVLGLPCPRFVV